MSPGRHRRESGKNLLKEKCKDILAQPRKSLTDDELKGVIVPVAPEPADQLSNSDSASNCDDEICNEEVTAAAVKRRWSCSVPLECLLPGKHFRKPTSAKSPNLNV